MQIDEHFGYGHSNFTMVLSMFHVKQQPLFGTNITKDRTSTWSERAKLSLLRYGLAEIRGVFALYINHFLSAEAYSLGDLSYRDAHVDALVPAKRCKSTADRTFDDDYFAQIQHCGKIPTDLGSGNLCVGLFNSISHFGHHIEDGRIGSS
ncbi:hypothetical protein [Pelagibius sp. Alg239-R121]|uniref:hypothetical protein n=1 Tax=Pelagibius sp. Alg239-R121 TaxID=2993448 RepID=UPI0024A66B97|nr:hypothetical protein [Pelagibius sp. Alg239-R121]